MEKINGENINRENKWRKYIYKYSIYATIKLMRSPKCLCMYP